MSEISGNTIFEHGGCFSLMLGLRSAVSEISGNTIFEHGGCFFLNAWSEISDEADLQLLCVEPQASTLATIIVEVGKPARWLPLLRWQSQHAGYHHS